MKQVISFILLVGVSLGQSHSGSAYYAEQVSEVVNQPAPTNGDPNLENHEEPSLEQLRARSPHIQSYSGNEDACLVYTKKQFLDKVPSAEFVGYAQAVAHELRHCVIAQTDAGEKSHILINPEGDVTQAGLTKEETTYYAVESGLYNCHKITCK